MLCSNFDMQKIVYAASPLICQAEIGLITIILLLLSYASEHKETGIKETGWHVCA